MLGGEDVTLHPRVVLYANSVLGPRTIVHSGAVIGADGFGMAEQDGRWLKVPQVGRVVIGADVEIGANTTIDRGAFGDTVVEDDVKLDNQIQIGHNCRIGAHTAIAGCTGIAGSTTIGRNCKIGGAAMIIGHLDIADGTTISACDRRVRVDSYGAVSILRRFPRCRIASGNMSHRSCAGCASFADQGPGARAGAENKPAKEGVTMAAMDVKEIMRLTCRIGRRFCSSIRVIECTRASSIKAIKNVTINEPFFQGHFPATR